MNHRCENSVSLGKSTLKGWKFRFAVHADIIESKHDITHGVLWKVSPKDLNSLDIFEGYPHYYDRKKVIVNHNDLDYEAWVYYMTTGIKSDLPGQYYWNMLTEGYNEHDVPLDQMHLAIKEIQQV